MTTSLGFDRASSYSFVSFRSIIGLIVAFLFLTIPSSDSEAATIVVPAGGDLQAAINSAKFGDTIILQSGATFDTPGHWVSFNLGDKGTPPTGTDADYITITTSDPMGIPLALAGYPANDVRITDAMAVNMPRVRTVGPQPVFWINRNAKYWRIKGLHLTSVPGSNTIRLIGLGEDLPRAISEYPDHIIIESNVIKPPEDTGGALASAHQSVESAIYLEGTNLIFRNNSMQGFLRRYPDGTRAASTCLLMTGWADNVLVENNLLEAWTYAVFFGGGSGGWTFPDKTATVSNCTPTSCTFSNTNGLAPGVPVAIGVYPVTLGGVPTYYWGNAFVASVSGSTVNFVKPLCNSDNTGGNGNTCKPFDANNPQQLPSNGNPARWDGYQVQNVTVRRNIFAHRPEWTTLMGSSSGKGHLELKACKNCTFDGNVFKGSTGPTITTRNQDGGAPWNDLDGLTFSNNYFMQGNSPFTAYLQDMGNLTLKSRNVRFTNNLVVGQFIEPGSNEAVISNNFSGGDNVTVDHNTVLIANHRGFVSFSPNTMSGLILRDNIFRVAPNPCFDYSSGQEVGALITTCWPNAQVNKNVLVNIDGWSTSDINYSWGDHYPDNTLGSSVASVGFVDPANLDASGNYRLSSSSAFKGKATDGTDPGVNYSQLIAALGFDPNGDGTSPSPTPESTPSPTPSPSPSPNDSLSIIVYDPTNNSTFAEGSNITISTNTVGQVARVDFYQNNEHIATDTSYPYTVVWSNVPRGNYALTAKATNGSGTSTMSNAVSISVVKKSAASVNRAKGKARRLASTEGSLANEEYAGAAGDGKTSALSSITTDIDSLVTDIEQAYADFLFEKSTYPGADRIETQLLASYHFTRADRALSSKIGYTPTVRNHLQRIAAHLAMTEDLMLFGAITPATANEALSVKARSDITFGPASAGYGETASSMVPASLGYIFGSPSVSPLSIQSLFASLRNNGEFNYEVGGVNVTVGGQPAPVVFVSPSKISFSVPPGLPDGTVEVLVTSQEGYISRGTVTITRNIFRLMTTSDDGKERALVVNALGQSPSEFDVTTGGNFGSDKRTRLTIFATGITGSAANTNTSNDISINGVNSQNFAESVVVEARKNTGPAMQLPVEFAGAQGTLPGMDQVIVTLGPSLKGAGTLRLTLIINGRRSNTATVVIR